jgi:5-deoxy-glucuronate isomerase
VPKLLRRPRSKIIVFISDYTADSLHFRPGQFPDDPGLLLNITPQLAGWEFLSFQVRRLDSGEQWRFSTAADELAFVTLSGSYAISSNFGSWDRVGARRNVFEGIAHTLYLPQRAKATVFAVSGGEFAIARAPSSGDHAPFLATPDDVTTIIRGGDNATRQINLLIPPGASVGRLVVVEVYTPPGSWSSFPAHKHDVHRVNEHGFLVEADLEEVYYYKIDKLNGYALQHIYTDPCSPLHKAGHPIDALVKVSDGDAVIVPEGYHPVVSAPGYTTYYLNVLAGSAQSLACSYDPKHAWIRDLYQTRDPRVPLYRLPREPKYEQ